MPPPPNVTFIQVTTFSNTLKIVQVLRTRGENHREKTQLHQNNKLEELF